MTYRRIFNILLKRLPAFLLAFAVAALMSGGALTWSACAEETGAGDGEGQAVQLGQAEIVPADEASEEAVEDIESDGDILLFSVGTGGQSGDEEDSREAADSMRVKLKCGKEVTYEDYKTHIFHVTKDGEKYLTYCIQPGVTRMSDGTKNARLNSMDLLNKALYYSYGYPGYSDKTKEYLSGKDLKKCYSGDNGAYSFCHILLSYIYKKEGGSSRPFRGVGDSTKKIIKELASEIKDWPDPAASAELYLSRNEVTAEWNYGERRQETQSIELRGTETNSIVLKIPENVTLVKAGSSGQTTDNEGGSEIKIETGESFYLTAGKDVTGEYKSPELEGSLSSFNSYAIVSGPKQDMLYGVNEGNRVSFSVEWMEFGDISLHKDSLDDEVSSGSGYYSLKDAEYGVYVRDTGEKYTSLMTDSEGDAQIEDVPEGEYYIKEIKAPRGFALDDESHDINVGSAMQDINVGDAPEKIAIETSASEESSGKDRFHAGGKVTIVDDVKYSGLTAGTTYRICGRLMNKKTGEALDGSEREKTFTPDSSGGTVRLSFDIDSDPLAETTLVAFERLYYEDMLLASHEDIDDQAQSVNVLKKEEAVPSTNPPGKDNGGTSVKADSYGPKTGDSTDLLLWGGVMLLALMTGAFALIRRKD